MNLQKPPTRTGQDRPTRTNDDAEWVCWNQLPTVSLVFNEELPCRDMIFGFRMVAEKFSELKGPKAIWNNFRALLIAALFCDVMMSSPLRVHVHVVHARAHARSREPNGPLESQRNGYVGIPTGGPTVRVLARPTCSEHHVMALSDAKRKKGRPR